MIKKKKYPKIEPHFVKDQAGKDIEVLLNYDVYNSISQEIRDIKKHITALKKKSLKK
jgi:hypothetical protein